MDFAEKIAHVQMVEIDSSHAPRSHEEILPQSAAYRAELATLLNRERSPAGKSPGQPTTIPRAQWVAREVGAFQPFLKPRVRADGRN
jgi:hypothetical protein